MQDARQTEIDFSRVQKYALLDRAQLPKIKGVGAPLLVLLLRTIYGHSGDDGWCWASQATLAAKCRCKDRKQIGRAMKGLKEHFLIAVKDREYREEAKKNVNHVRICWGNLAELPTIQRPDHRDISQGALGHLSHPVGTFEGGPLGHSCGGRGDMHVPLINHNHQEQPPTSTPGAVAVVPDDWKRAEQELQAEGVAIASKLCSEAKAGGQGARDVLAVIHDYRANRSRLKGPGAIVTRLRNGVWPAAGVGVASDLEAKQEAANKAREWDLMRTKAFVIERDARRRGASVEERRELLRQKIPADVLPVLAQAELRFLFE